LSQDLEMELYRIAQEAVTNTVKHAKAKKIRLQLTFSTDKFYMDIWDNGVGFNKFDSDAKGGFGLQSITERVKRIKGKVAINSNLGEGTLIKLEIPI
jgi:signal transduction histidine kinase